MYDPMTYSRPYSPFGATGMSFQPAAPAGIIWVQGEAGAKSYMVAPNNTVVLFDSERESIYIKSADASGMPSMKTLDYSIRGGQPMRQNVEYATKADLEELRKKIEALTKGAE